MKENKIDIFRAKGRDIKILRKISIQTFKESFSAVNTIEDMELYLAENFNEKILLNELQNPNIRYYFGFLEEKPVAYLKLNFGEAQNELKSKASLEIERIYVIKKFQGKNIGQQLFEKVLNLAQENKMELIWLGVWEKNHDAIRFYKRNGFVEFDKHLFKLGKDEQTDIMMKLELNEKRSIR